MDVDTRNDARCDSKLKEMTPTKRVTHATNEWLFHGGIVAIKYWMLFNEAEAEMAGQQQTSITRCQG